MRAVDRWLFAPGTGHRLAVLRTGLVALIGARVALGPYRALAGQPHALFRPVPFLRVLPGMPPLGVMIALQIVGAGAALVFLLGRPRRAPLVVAWASLLVLAGLRGSLGKILHNDVLLVLATVPVLLAPLDARLGDRRPSVRYGWPVRAALVVVAGSYLFTAYWKLRYSGAAWVTSDNIRFILAEAARSGRAPTMALSTFIGDRAWLSHLTGAAILGGEVLFPLVLVWRRLWPVAAVWAVVMHAGTWVALGLDYWVHLAVVLLVIVDWTAVPDRLPGRVLNRTARSPAAASPR